MLKWQTARKSMTANASKRATGRLTLKFLSDIYNKVLVRNRTSERIVEPANR